MDKEKLKIFAIFFLGISILIGSVKIADGLDSVAHRSVNTNNISNAITGIGNRLSHINEKEKEPGVLYMTDAANYLGIPFSTLEAMVKDPASNIPYFKLHGVYYFYKQALDQWILEKGQYEFSSNPK